uniref:Uncharacterized protein n=1 Tax=Parascaris equorum TaxID=6256 RepID=A0A914R5L1_PAREQ
MFFVGDPMKMDMITKTLEPIPLCDRLFQSGYESVVKKVRELMVNKYQVLYHKGNGNICLCKIGFDNEFAFFVLGAK